MEFRVFGSIDAWGDGRPVALGGLQQRRLLAVLPADAGHVVSIDRLVETVRPDDTAPDGAAPMTRTYVSRFRGALGDGFVVTRGPGYLIDVSGGEFDKASFEQLLAEAPQADCPLSVQRYDQALVERRGRVLADFAQGQYRGSRRAVHLQVRPAQHGHHQRPKVATTTTCR